MPTLLQGSNPNRLVAVLTPLVFAPLAGAIAAEVAKYGVDVDDGQVQAIFIAGATIALAKSAQWTKGWQAFEQRHDATAPDPLAIGAEDDLHDDADDEPEDEDVPQDLASGAALADAEDGLDDDAHDETDAGMDAEMDMDDDDFDDDLHDDLDAEAAELLAGHGS